MRYFALAAVVLGFMLSTEWSSAEELKIGAILPLTGPAAFLGEIHRAGLTIGVDYINERGGINGIPLSLIIEDSRSEPRAGVLAYNKLAEADRVPVLFSSLTSIAMAIRPLTEQKKVVVLAESSHPKLTEGYRYVFRNFYTVDSANEVLESFMKQRGLHKLAVIHTEDEFGVAAASDLENRLRGGVAQLVGVESFKTTDNDLRVQLLRIKNRQPELIYVVGVGPVIGLAYLQARQLGIEALLGGYLAYSQRSAFTGASWRAAEGSFAIEPKLDLDGKLYRELSGRFAKKFPGRDFDDLSAVAFDGVQLIAAAYLSGARSGEEIRSFLASATPVTGITGMIAFDHRGESRRPMSIREVNNGNRKNITSNSN